MPWAFVSPKKLPFCPPNGNMAMGAATPMLTPTMPAWMRSWNSRADLPLWV